MIGSLLQRYGWELLHEPDRLRLLVEHHCDQHSLPKPSQESWLPVQERWLLGWPERGSAAFLDRYRGLRTGLLQSLGSGSVEGWLDHLPAITVMPAPRSEVDVGQGPGRQPNLVEALARLGWGGRLVLDENPQLLPPVTESELYISGEEERPTPLELGQARWPRGWLRLENLTLSGELEIAGGLVELRRCTLQSGAQLRVCGPGAVLVLDHSDLYGEVEAQACTLLQVCHSTFEGAAIGLESAGLTRLEGVAFRQHTQAALVLRERSRALFEDCQLSESGLGLRISGQSRAWLRQSWLRANHQIGVLAEDDASLKMEGCHVRSNRSDGLWLRGRSHLRLSGSTVQDNQGAGVRYTDQVTLEQDGNQVVRNVLGDWLDTAGPSRHPTRP
jgi:hypothetical protein